MKITTITSFSEKDLEKALAKIKRSIWVYHLNTGSCNGCDIEILDVLTPWFDVERFGIRLVASPRHTDLVLLTGPITVKTLSKVIKALRAVPRPRLVMAIGSCAVGGNIWFESYSTIGGFYKILDKLNDIGIVVDRVIYVPGCPARPEAIIYGTAVLLGLLKPKTHYKRVEA
ncbi:MAG: NADH:ubiquinone oxidoreductase [Ignisphaera sp.]|uniref:NADH:ubiquinone oxidoreductase n=1 Tax=Ignisphaera aggregans TaxID=334771 RepID=A0A7C4D045_9CREN